MGKRIVTEGNEAVEDYAKAIYALEARSGAAVSTSALAERLEVSPAAVTSMLKRLEALRLITYKPYRGARLTPAGERIALEVIRHHRLLESYLADALGMPWDQVHAEAEVLEHYISEELETLIAASLGQPERDPHGDPIPTADLEIAAESSRSLDELEPGEGGVFSRVSDSDPGMLRYLADRGIAPGDRVEVLERQPYGGPVFARIGDAVHPLGGELAAAMRIETTGGASAKPGADPASEGRVRDRRREVEW